MRLALAMGRTLAELAESMSADEFVEWLAFNRVFGLPDSWGEAGTIAAACERPWTKKGVRPREALDFIPAERRPKRQSVREMRAAMASVAARANAVAARTKGLGLTQTSGIVSI